MSQKYRDRVSRFFSSNHHKVFHDSTFVSEWERFVWRAVMSSRLSQQNLSSSVNVLSDIGT